MIFTVNLPNQHHREAGRAFKNSIADRQANVARQINKGRYDPKYSLLKASDTGPSAEESTVSA